jgi:anaerobic dimethyl sulfoxide reductase subunit A
VFNPHYLRRSHSTFDNVPWLRKAFAHPIFINSEDAAEKGIATGDTVLIWNENGKTLRPAAVTGRVMKGVIGLPHGGWIDIDEATGIDHGGADNLLCGSHESISGVTGWNTCLVDFAKYDGPALEPDVEWPQRIPIKEA